jgi:type IV secretory pathway protease TraF
MPLWVWILMVASPTASIVAMLVAYRLRRPRSLPPGLYRVDGPPDPTTVSDECRSAGDPWEGWDR